MILYIIEGTPPETFISIPRAMWWSIAVLTNVEYGYVYPIKLLGMTCVSFITLIVIRIVALPAGIIAENFRNELSEDDKDKYFFTNH